MESSYESFLNSHVLVKREQELQKFPDLQTHILFYLYTERPTDDELEASGNDKCPKLECGYCRHGYVKDSDGCSTCECIKGKNIKAL